MLCTFIRKVGVFGQKAITRVNRITACCNGDVNQRGNRQITVLRRRRSDTHCPIGSPDVRRNRIGCGINGNRLEAKTVANVDRSQCNLTSIGDQNTLETQHFSLLGHSDARNSENLKFLRVSLNKTIDFVYRDWHSVRLITVLSSFPETEFIYD